MEGDRIEIRPAVEPDRPPLALLFAAVAEERDGIAAEPPIDVEKWATNWRLEGTLVTLERVWSSGKLASNRPRLVSARPG